MIYFIERKTMRIVNRGGCIYIFALVTALSFVCGDVLGAGLDKDKMDAVEKKFTTTVSNFNGSVEVTVTDKDGKPTKVVVLIEPGEKLKVPRGIPPKMERLEWKDVAQYEAMLISVNVQDPYSRWYMENLWRDRINKTITALEERVRAEYPQNYEKINVSVKEVADALGIEPPIGFLTGETFTKIPNDFGGRIPNVDPNVLYKDLYRSDYIGSVFLDESMNRTASPSS